MGQQGSVEGGGAATSSKDVMSAWVIETKTGKMDDMICTDNLPIPVPEAGHVRIKVMAASLNYTDIKKGTEGSTFPMSLGMDGAGVIDFIPEGTASLLPVGSKVYFKIDDNSKYGTLSEYTIVPVERLFIIQPGVSFPSAAALPTTGWAAYYALHYRMKVTSGKTIYVTGGGGGMGGFVCQLCKAAGLRVITSCSAYNAEYASSRGAQDIIDYTSLDVKTEIMKLTNDRGVDYCLDILDDTSSVDPMNLLAIGGHLCVTNRLIKLSPLLLEKNISIHYINMASLSRSVTDIKPIADTVMHLVSKRTLDDNIGEIGKWNSVRGGYKTLESRHVRGKLVINIEPVHSRRKKLQSQPTYKLVAADQLKSLVESHPNLGSSQLAEDRLATASQVCSIIKKDKDLVHVQVGTLTFWVPEKAVQLFPAEEKKETTAPHIIESHAALTPEPEARQVETPAEVPSEVEFVASGQQPVAAAPQGVPQAPVPVAPVPVQNVQPQQQQPRPSAVTVPQTAEVAQQLHQQDPSVQQYGTQQPASHYQPVAAPHPSQSSTSYSSSPTGGVTRPVAPGATGKVCFYSSQLIHVFSYQNET